MPDSVTNDARINELFSLMPKVEASDLHLKAGLPPMFRIDGQLRRAKKNPLSDNGPELSAEQLEELVKDWLGPEALAELKDEGSKDIGHEWEGGRVRVALFLQRGRISLVARLINESIPSLQELHLPETLKRVVDMGEGICLVCGVTGSGKSTTLACLLDEMNEQHAHHILTFEDPIEFIYDDRRSVINQREYGLDFHHWPEAIRTGVRSDPDVMLIGEMRDEETFQLGLTAAETGHLVFGTMHTSGAQETVGRILDLFPPDRHTLIRQMLAFNLKAIVCQRLIPSFREDIGRVPAVEIMWKNPSIAKAIEEGDDHTIGDLIQSGEEEGMQTWTSSLVQLVNDELVAKDVALEHAPNRDALKMALKGISF